MQKEKTGFIYIWYDRKNKMYYIGCHLGEENDGYICSSNRMRAAHRRRPFSFKRRILQRNIPKYELLEAEQKWLSLIPDEELGKKYYNLCKNVHNFFLSRKNISSAKKARERLSEAAKNRDTTPYKNRMSVRHKITGWQGKIDCKDYDKEIYESLVCRTDKKVTVIDENGNSFGVTKEEFQQNKDKWKTHSSVFNKGKVIVIDKEGKKLKVSVDDPRIGTELKVHTGFATSTKGTVPVFTTEGKCIRVPKDDPKILSGEYILQCGVANRGRIIINNGKENKRIYPEDLTKYEGWVRGMLTSKKKIQTV